MQPTVKFRSIGMLAAVLFLCVSPVGAASAKKASKAAAPAEAPAAKGPAAKEPAAKEPERTLSMRELVEQRLPDVLVRKVVKTNYPGIFEVIAEDKIFYTDEKVSFFLVGNLIDAKSMRNVTEERTQDLMRIRFDMLPLDLAVKTVKGNGSRKLVVFSDPDCPFCQKLEKELVQINDVTIYTFLYPIPSLHADATRKAKAVWCAPDRAKAWEELMQKGTQPQGPAECDNPIGRLAELGAALRVNGTPTMILADGRVVPGAVPAKELEQFLKQAEGK